MEFKLFDGDVPHVSTPEFHADRPRAPHLEQPIHRPRLELAAAMVLAAATVHSGRTGAQATLSDLGCGDGGLLSLAQDQLADAWGYDFSPANAEGWTERGVKAEALDVFGADRDRVRFGDITTCTEVLEHIADPHGAVRWIGEHSSYLIASSPWNEGPGHADECHAWAWDQAGYRALIEQGGFRVLRQDTVFQFQVVLGWRP
jgi:predicted TPR repeat methyltransferase